MSIDTKAGYNITQPPVEPKSIFSSDSDMPDNVSLSEVDFTEGVNSDLTSPSTVAELFGKIKYFISHIANKIADVITASATVDDTTGTPSVDVVKTFVDNKVDFRFDFSGLKGEPGSGSDINGDFVDVDNELAYSGKIKNLSITKSGNAQLISTVVADETTGNDETFTDGFYTLPSGGTEGQILKKGSSSGLFEWGDESGGLPEGGYSGQYLMKGYNQQSSPIWADIDGNMIYPRLEILYNNDESKDTIVKLKRTRLPWDFSWIYMSLTSIGNNQYTFTATNKSSEDTNFLPNFYLKGLTSDDSDVIVSNPDINWGFSYGTYDEYFSLEFDLIELQPDETISFNITFVNITLYDDTHTYDIEAMNTGE